LAYGIPDAENDHVPMNLRLAHQKLHESINFLREAHLREEKRANDFLLLGSEGRTFVCTRVMKEKMSEKVLTMSIMWAGVRSSWRWNMRVCHCPVKLSKTRKKMSSMSPHSVAGHVSGGPIESSPKLMSSVENMKMEMPNLVSR